jgi:hypothetical protein
VSFPNGKEREEMREYGHPVQTIRGTAGQMLKTGHCNVCGAVLAISVDGTPFAEDEPEILQHRLWHETMFAAIEEAKADV